MARKLLKTLARPEGVEPPTYRFEACRSIHLSYGRAKSSPGNIGMGPSGNKRCELPARRKIARDPWEPPGP